MRSRLPPLVELDLAAPTTKDRPIETWRRLQEAGSVVRARLSLLGTPALATRYETARQVLTDESRFTVDATRVGRRRRTGVAWWVPSGIAQLADNVMVYEGDEHRHRRRQVESAFRGAALQRLQPVIDRQTDACITTLMRSRTPCFVRHLARPLPLLVIGDLLGLDPALSASGTPTGRALRSLSSISGPLSLFRAVPHLQRLGNLLARELDARRIDPRDDLLSALASPLDDGSVADRDTAISMVFLLYLAGHETTTHLLSTATLERLRRAPGFQTLPPKPDARACSELLRVLSPVEMSKPRFVVQDTELDGYRLERGSTVAALIGAANHDDTRWADPERLDTQRAPQHHLGFGSGTHACLGLQLALRETATVLSRLGDRLPDMALQDPAARPAWARRTGLRALRSLPLKPV